MAIFWASYFWLKCRGRRRRSGLLRSGANCAAPERKSLDLRRPPRHFIAKQEKRPGKPAYYRTKMHSDPVHPAKIVLTRTNRYLTRKNPVIRKNPLQTVRKVLARLKYSVPLYKDGNSFSILTEECLTFRTVSPRYQNSRIREATSSSSHFGVDVAPQTPARSSRRNHSGRTSAGLVT